ncbi:MAG: calcium/sodium antiporter [Salinivenus sp.]
MILLLIAGLLLLVAGAEALVRGASRLALGAGLSPLVVGLTVVAFGTSAPELAVSVGSSLSGQGDLALGNVVGSNVFNVLFILGISALVAPLVADRQLTRLDVPIGIAVAGASLLLAIDGRVGRIDGLLLVGGLVGYTALQVGMALRSKGDGREEAGGILPVSPASGEEGLPGTLWAWLLNLGLVVGGLGLLVLGARWFVEGAVTAARSLGVSELVIGLTIVAGGTSLPELATSMLASLRGQREIAVGNVVGSNIFNLLGVLGLSAVVAPEGVAVSSAALWFDFPVMIAAAVACLPIFYTGHIIERWEGALFLVYYGAYTSYLILAATAHDALSTFSLAMGAFVLPLTAITLAVLAARAWRGQHASR